MIAVNGKYNEFLGRLTFCGYTMTRVFMDPQRSGWEVKQFTRHDNVILVLTGKKDRVFTTELPQPLKQETRRGKRAKPHRYVPVHKFARDSRATEAIGRTLSG